MTSHRNRADVWGFFIFPSSAVRFTDAVQAPDFWIHFSSQHEQEQTLVFTCSFSIIWILCFLWTLTLYCMFFKRQVPPVS